MKGSYDEVTKQLNSFPGTNLLIRDKRSGQRVAKTTDKDINKKRDNVMKKLDNYLKSKSQSDFAHLIDEVILGLNISNMRKGRSEKETRAVLKYMLTALYNIKAKEQNFNAKKLFDEVA